MESWRSATAARRPGEDGARALPDLERPVTSAPTVGLPDDLRARCSSPTVVTVNFPRRMTINLRNFPATAAHTLTMGPPALRKNQVSLGECAALAMWMKGRRPSRAAQAAPRAASAATLALSEQETSHHAPLRRRVPCSDPIRIPAPIWARRREWPVLHLLAIRRALRPSRPGKRPCSPAPRRPPATA